MWRYRDMPNDGRHSLLPPKELPWPAPLKLRKLEVTRTRYATLDHYLTVGFLDPEYIETLSFINCWEIYARVTTSNYFVNLRCLQIYRSADSAEIHEVLRRLPPLEELRITLRPIVTDGIQSNVVALHKHSLRVLQVWGYPTAFRPSLQRPGERLSNPVEEFDYDFTEYGALKELSISGSLSHFEKVKVPPSLKVFHAFVQENWNYDKDPAALTKATDSLLLRQTKLAPEICSAHARIFITACMPNKGYCGVVKVPRHSQPVQYCVDSIYLMEQKAGKTVQKALTRAMAKEMMEETSLGNVWEALPKLIGYFDLRLGQI
ncbi:hypothetical protein ABW21_db0206160 [Orbilia brochopaga]|nr:hypothetical protein ABW21_db0206160 [Drechslerella brochopaga]